MELPGSGRLPLPLGGRLDAAPRLIRSNLFRLARARASRARPVTVLGRVITGNVALTSELRGRAQLRSFRGTSASPAPSRRACTGERCSFMLSLPPRRADNAE